MPGTATNPSMLTVRLLSPGLMLISMLILTVYARPLQAGSNLPRPDLPKGQKHEIRHEIDHLEEAWREAILKQDPAAMATLLADDYMAITAFGTLQTKDQALANLRSGRMHFTTLDVFAGKAGCQGRTALLTRQGDGKGGSAGGDMCGGWRYTRF